MFSRCSYRVLPSILALAVLPNVIAADLNPEARLPVPSPETQMETMKLVKQLYGGELGAARTVDQKRGLAEKLLRTARETESDPTARYVLLKTARDVAVIAGDSELALRAVRAMGATYQIDLFTMQVNVLLRAANAATPRYGPITADGALVLIKQAEAKDDYKLAKQLAKVTLELAQGTQDAGLEGRLRLRLEELEQRAATHKEQAGETQTQTPAGLIAGLKNPFAGRNGMAKQSLLVAGGGTAESERAVAAALAWLARHQNPDGSWSIDYHARCRGPGCTGPGGCNAPGAATAFGLLPFLAAGQTHETKGPYKDNIYRGITWMISHQKPTGDLSASGEQTQMYSHGLATIMLCEAYGMSHDKRLEAPAKAALHFIETCQDQQTGGWRYTYRQPGGDTSVFGWQLMAMKSGMMAGLIPSHACFDLAKKWLDSVGKGTAKGLFSYVPRNDASDTMTAVGLLCTQYLGAGPGNPRIAEGEKFLMAHLPNASNGKVYYWYYATQVMHNLPGADWDKWNRQMRTVLIKTQCGDAGCANGSWDPMNGMPEWAAQGGRLMMTSLAALTLEVYYRYPPYNYSAPGN